MICKSCNKEERGPEGFSQCSIRDLMESDGICFTCAFWEEHARRFKAGYDKGKVFFVNGNRYHDGGMVDKRSERGFVGHGGYLFKIKMLDTGKIIETNNLWHQGSIPEHFRERMPNNAEFINDKF